MREHPKSPPESADPGTDLREDSLAPSADEAPVEESGTDEAGGVDRESVVREGGESPDRQGMESEEPDIEAPRRSEESV